MDKRDHPATHPLPPGRSPEPGPGAIMEALQESSRQLLTFKDFKETAAVICRILKKLLGAAAGYVALLSKDGRDNDLLFLDAGGLPCAVDPSLPMPIRGMRAEAYQTGRVIFENDFPGSPWAAFLPPEHARLTNVLVAPLNIQEKTVGVIGLANKPGGFTEADARAAGLFAELAAVALANSRHLQLLRSSEEHFRAVAQTATDAIVSTDGNGLITFWNNRASALFGYSEQEAIGRPVTIIIPERLQEKHCEAMKRVRVTGIYHLVGRTVEITGRHRDGHEIPIELSLSEWESGGEIHFSAIIRDISERKKIEEALKASEERYRVIFESATEGIIVADLETRVFRYVNPAICDLFGYTEGEFLQLTVRDLHPQDALDRVLADVEALAGGLKKVASGIPCVRKNNRPFFADVTAARMQMGEQPCLVGFFTDATDRKLAEEMLEKAQTQLEWEVQNRTAELRQANTRLREEMTGRQKALQALEQSERKFRAIFNQTFQLIGLLKPDGSVLEVNQSTLDFLGLDYAETIGKSLLNLRPGTVPPPLREQVKKGIAEAARGNFVRFELPVDIPPRDRQWIDFSIKPVFNDPRKEELLIVEARDISALKKSELALQDSENRLRLLSAQVLQAQETERKRIAKELHDGVGQYLSAIKYRVEHALIQKSQTKGRPAGFLQDMIPVIQGAIEEIRNICMDLRPSILDDLGIRATLSWFCREFQKTYSHIHIETELSAQEEQIPEYLKIIIFRVTQEALNNIGKHSAAGSVRLALARDDQHLWLEIKDDGRGFAVEQIGSGTAEGRGLGLGSMRERTELSGGAFQITSLMGEGTQVRATWPLVNADAG